MDVSFRIKQLRLKKGITVNRLANISGVSQSYLRDVELGKKQPTVEYLSYICDGLGITLEGFFSDEEDPLIGEIKKMNPRQKAALLELIKALRHHVM